MKRAGLTALLTVIILVILAALGYVAVRNKNQTGSYLGRAGIVKDGGENISDYSAVFLTNGQVYFGKLNSIGDTEVVLSDIFYLQVNQQIQPDQKATPSPSPSADASNPNIVLVKLGDELHGPNDRMRINRDQILFTESMKKDSKVVKAIDDYKASKK